MPKKKPLSPEIRDLPQRFVAAVTSMPRPLGLFLLYVSILKYPPEEAARAVGIPPEEAREKLILARGMLRNFTFEHGEPRS